MNTVKRMVAFVSNAALVILLGSASMVIVGYLLRLFAVPYARVGLVGVLALTMKAFIWLLPLTAVLLLVGMLLEPAPASARRDD